MRIHEIRARLLPYADTMLDILLLPPLMHSPPIPPVLCFRSLNSIDCFSDLLWPLAEYQELEKRVQSELSCYPSPLVCYVLFLKYTALGFSISYPFHRVTSPIWKSYYFLGFSDLELLTFTIVSSTGEQQYSISFESTIIWK